MCVNSIDLDQTAPKEWSDEGLHCLPCLPILLHISHQMVKFSCLKTANCPNSLMIMVWTQTDLEVLSIR